MNILALDIGTTSMRGILFGPAGEILAEQTVETPLLIDKSRNQMEQRPEAFIDGLVLIARAIANQAQVDAISVTAFRSAPTLVDRQGRALHNFIMWQDTRNREICQQLRGAGAQVYRTCGASINTVFTATKLTWFRQNMPELYDRAYKAMIVPDYVIHHMTGVFSTDYTYGSRTLLMNLTNLQWDADMCALFQVDMEKLCELRQQGAIVGGVTPAFAKITGIACGTPVISAGGDQQCGALGLGVIGPEAIEVNSGTGSFVISLVDRPYLDNPSVICNVAAIPGMYTQEMNIIASASALDWLIREFFPEWMRNGRMDFDTINRIAEETPLGAHGLYIVPHFQGCGSRDWNPDARACMGGFTLASHRNDLIRALYEGIAAEISKSIDVLPEICRSAKTIAVAGGLSKSDVYNQILCDMTGRTLSRCPNAQATAVGAYLSAAVTLGQYRDYQEALSMAFRGENCRVYIPDRENHLFYQGYKAKTEQLYRSALSP